MKVEVLERSVRIKTKDGTGITVRQNNNGELTIYAEIDCISAGIAVQPIASNAIVIKNV